MSFEGKNIIVTGAGQGIGRGLCIALAEQGATYPTVIPICLDIANWDETREALLNIGLIHGLVNNAGVGFLEPFLDITEQAFDNTFSVNVKAVINISQIVAKKMIESKIQGTIVNVSSQASLRGLNEHGVYCASKAALDGLTRVMALELGSHQIRVNCVNPTVVMTELGRRVWSDPMKSEKMLSRIPQKKFAEVKDVVDAVLFLLSDKSSMINGVTLPVDGGFLAV